MKGMLGGLIGAGLLVLLAGGSVGSNGSADELRGLVCVEHIFVDDPAAPWSQELRDEALASSRDAMNYLQSEARARRIELSFREESTRYSSPTEVPVDFHDYSWTADALGDQLVPLGLYLPIASCPVRDCDQRLTILHVAKVGRSYALPARFNEDERIVMYLRKRAMSPLDGAADAGQVAEILRVERPASFVHEILHLFGAEDLYEPESRRRAAEERYPGDVMLQSHRPLESVEIGPYSAFAIGWTREVPAPLPSFGGP